MASRMFFIIQDEKVLEKTIDFNYYRGFAISQKKKSVVSLHYEIKKKYFGNILEVSSKSLMDLGVKLSAFNLKVEFNGKQVSVENIFQSSKVFEYGGPYTDLLSVTPLEAKKDERIRNSGRLVYFRFDNTNYPLIPETAFYDWIYCNAMLYNKDLSEHVSTYDVFTDIEFNHEKSLNCQARSLAIFVLLKKINKLYLIRDFNQFVDFVYSKIYNPMNEGLFDL